MANYRARDVSVNDNAGGSAYLVPPVLSTVSGVIGRHDGDSLFAVRDDAGPTYTYTLAVPSGDHEVYVWWSAAAAREPQVPVRLVASAGTTSLEGNQRTDGGRWNLPAVVTAEGGRIEATIEARGRGYTTCADALRIVEVR